LPTGGARAQDVCLNVLARALDHNPSSPALWLVYLPLFARRSPDELPDMLNHAVPPRRFPRAARPPAGPEAARATGPKP